MSKKDIEKKVRKIVRKLFEELKTHKSEGFKRKHISFDDHFDIAVTKDINEDLSYNHEIWLLKKGVKFPSSFILKTNVYQNPKQEKRLAIEKITNYLYKEAK